LAEQRSEAQALNYGAISKIERNLDDSFIDDEATEDIHQFDELERELDVHFHRQKRISCFAYNVMLAVKKVRKMYSFSFSY